LKQSAVALWLKLLFTLGFSATVAFLFMAGTVMLKTGSALIGIATGMISAAICMLGVFQSSKLTRGLLVVVPKAVTEVEAQTATQVISK
jgi:uncharacterized membrane protein SpoIIM required for sporulation